MPSVPTPSIIDTRRDQMYPTLEPSEIERVRRFGKTRAFAPEEPLAKMGKVGGGLSIILSGEVDVTRYDSSGQRAPVVTLGPGALLGELAQLAGRPALVDATGRGPVDGLIIPPDQLRALLVAEAELGERIMRALILRRVRLLETGAGGPVIVGRGDNGDVLRLQGFLRRNGHPHLRLDPEVDAEAKALIERFHVDSGQLPIVLCPGGQLLRNPGETELARCIGLVGPIDPNRVYDVAIVGAGPSGLAAAVYAGSEGLRALSTAVHSAGRLAPRRGSVLRRPGLARSVRPRDTATRPDSALRLRPPTTADVSDWNCETLEMSASLVKDRCVRVPAGTRRGCSTQCRTLTA